MKRDLKRISALLAGLAIVVGGMGFGTRVALAAECLTDADGVCIDDGSCTCPSTGPSTVSCTGDYIDQGDGTCDCPSGEVDDGSGTSTCVSDGTADAPPVSCDGDYVDQGDGTCDCPDGEMDDGSGTSTCVSDGSTDASCPEGEDFDADGNCVASTAPSSTTTTTTTTTATTAAHALSNPLGSTDLRVVIGYVIRALLGLSGAVALFVFVWSGLMMMLAAGDAKKITTAKSSLVWATIGLVVIFTSYTLVYTLITALSTGTTG